MSDGIQKSSITAITVKGFESLNSDRRIASLDEEVRRLFDGAAQYVGQIRLILWVNPAVETDKITVWLESDAPDEVSLRLGRRATNA